MIALGIFLFLLGILFTGGLCRAAGKKRPRCPENTYENDYAVTKTRDRHTANEVVSFQAEPVAQNFEAQRAAIDAWGHSSMNADCASLESEASGNAQEDKPSGETLRRAESGANPANPEGESAMADVALPLNIAKSGINIGKMNSAETTTVPLASTPLPVNATFNPMNAFPGGRWG